MCVNAHIEMEDDTVSAFSKQNAKLAREYVPMIFGLRIPGFIRVHMRYARHNPVTWLVLFLAPFVIGVMSFTIIGEKLLEVKTSGWQLNFLVLFLIALAFFFSERNRKFRRIYVMAIPVVVVVTPWAKRGHMKSLYLLCHSHEYGNGCEIGRITAARFYDKAGRKGYGKAHIAFETLFDTFSPEETKTFETNLGISEINELI